MTGGTALLLPLNEGSNGWAAQARQHGWTALLSKYRGAKRFAGTGIPAPGSYIYCHYCLRHTEPLPI
jgi:hypothetical protein